MPEFLVAEHIFHIFLLSPPLARMGWRARRGRALLESPSVHAIGPIPVLRSPLRKLRNPPKGTGRRRSIGPSTCLRRHRRSHTHDDRMARTRPLPL